jgi:carboxypeptidase C (cathepsin A)
MDNILAAVRPVTFFYNGGPGSATVWLHLGSFGPKRLVTGDPSTTAPTPFPLVDNMETLLDTSDLVFVDAVGTGYSEAIAPNTNQSFWSVDRDAASFRDFVVRWLAANGRNASPKYLFGESYGTTRTPVVADLLETAGVHLDGIVLQSSILNYGTNCDGQSDTVSCAGFVPSYGQAGAYYRLATAAVPGSDANAQQLRNFTTAGYDPAVVQWFSQRTPPSGALANDLQAQTGLAAARWSARVNLEPSTYRNALIPGVLIGRYDARVSAPQGTVLANEGDPSSTFITAQFNQAIATYLKQALQYTNASAYVTSSGAINSWDFRHDGQQVPDVIPDLAAALALHPQMKVLALNGYHDLATPFFQTDRDLARLGPLPNVSERYYDGGHMTYLDDTSRAKEKQDLRTFYTGAAQ